MSQSASSLGFDPGAVAEWMQSHGIGVAPPLHVTRLLNGASNITCLARDSAGHEWVLRRPPQGLRLDSAHDVVREYRILRALEGSAVPTPRAHALIEDSSICDAPIMIMERLDGQVIVDRTAAEALDLPARRRCGFSVVEALAALHAVDLQASGLATLASQKPYAQRQLDRWLRQARTGTTPLRPAMLTVAARLQAALPEQQQVTLVHGDCHLVNVLVDRSGNVRGLLDWELGTLGDPMADVGTMLAYWPQPDDPVGPGPLDQACVAGFARRDELAEHYVRFTGRSDQHIGFWEALAAWKIAVISKGVLERAKARGISPSREAALNEQIDVMLARSAMAADSAGF
jgi:aminoglycoside phosphotransferase (APT) family kinase protein